MFEFIPNAVERISKGTKAVADPFSWADTVGSLQKLNLKLKYIIINISGDYKASLINLN